MALEWCGFKIGALHANHLLPRPMFAPLPGSIQAAGETEMLTPSGSFDDIFVRAGRRIYPSAPSRSLDDATAPKTPPCILTILIA